MIDEKNYQEWAMEYIEGTLGAEQRREFSAFLASCPAASAQIEALATDMPVLQPETVVYPDKELLLRGRKIRLARRQDRLQRFGAMASGAAAAAVLFGGLLFFEPGTGKKGTEKMAAEAVEVYPEGVEALAEATEQTAAEKPATEISGRHIATTQAATKVAAATPATTAQTRRTARSTAPAAKSGATATAAQGQSGAMSVKQASPSHTEATTGTPVSESLAQAAAQHVSAENLLAVPSVTLPVTIATASTPTPAAPAFDTPVETVASARPETARNAPARRSRAERQEEESGRGIFGELLATLNDISPVSRYKTTEESGVTIGSFIRISKRNDQETR